MVARLLQLLVSTELETFCFLENLLHLYWQQGFYETTLQRQKEAPRAVEYALWNSKLPVSQMGLRSQWWVVRPSFRVARLWLTKRRTCCPLTVFLNLAQPVIYLAKWPPMFGVCWLLSLISSTDVNLFLFVFLGILMEIEWHLLLLFPRIFFFFNDN